jgi:flagellar biosynthesis protein FliR
MGMDDTMQLLQVVLNLPLLAMVLARISGLVAFVPFFGNASIPMNARALLAFAITIIVLPFAAEKMVPPPNLGALVVALVGELLIGLVFGLMITAIFSGLELAGLLIGQQLGISLAQVFDPLFEEETSVLGQLYFWLALVIFLLVRGHLVLLGALIRSFHSLPLGNFTVNPEFLRGLTTVLHSSFILALQVSAPVIVAIFLTTLALGFVGRTVPQLNILSVGFSLRMVLGYILITVCLVPAMNVFNAAVQKTLGGIYELMGLPGMKGFLGA